MVIRTNTAYLGGAGALTLGADDYTAAVTSFALTPNTPKTVVRDIGGGVQTIVGKPAWDAAIAYNQDWTTLDSFSKKLNELAGTAQPFTYTPNDGGEGRSGILVIEHGTFGGPADGVHSATVTLSLNGQPVIVPAA